MAEIVEIEKTWDYDDPSDRLVTFAFESDESKGTWRVKSRSFVRGTVITHYYFPETEDALNRLLDEYRARMLALFRVSNPSPPPASA